MKTLPIIHTNDTKAIVPINGVHYNVNFELIYDDRGVPVKCVFHEFSKTDKPLTVDDRKSDYIQWRGFPFFRQGQVVPTDDNGIEYSFLCVINDGWGDSGAINIFVLIVDDALVDHWMEYSCS